MSPATASVPRGDGLGRRAGRHGAGFARAATLVALLLLAAPATSQQIGAWQLNRGAFGDVHWGAPVATQAGLLLLTGGAGECHAAIDTGARCCWSTNVADWVCGSSSLAASDVAITDAGGYFTGIEVEAALQEIGAGTALDGRYVRRDGSDGLIPGTDSVTLQPQTQPGASPTNFMRVDQYGASASAGDGGDHGAGFVLGTDGNVALTSSADSVSITAFLHTLLLANTGALTLDGSPIETEISADARYAPLAHTHPANDISDSTAAGRALLTAADAAAQRTAQGLGTAATKDVPASGNAAAGEVVKGSDTRLSDARTPTAHTHPASEISDSTAAGRTLVTAADAAAQRTALALDAVTDDAQTKASVMPNTAPSAGQVPVGNVGGTAYVPRSISGDFTLDSAGAATFASVISSGSCGDATHSCSITYDAKGRLIAVTSNAISAGANPAGSGSELQYRSSGSAFGAVTSSSVSGANVTFGGVTDGGTQFNLENLRLDLNTLSSTSGDVNITASSNNNINLDNGSTTANIRGYRFQARDQAAWRIDQDFGLQFKSTFPMGWSSGNASTSPDTKLERGAAGVTKFTSAIRLAPLASPPESCASGSEGDLYADTSHALCYCDGTTWNVVSGAGTCS